MAAVGHWRDAGGVESLGSFLGGVWERMKGFFREQVGGRFANLIEHGSLRNRAELAKYTVDSVMALNDPNAAFEALIAAKEKGIIGDKEMAEVRPKLYARQSATMNENESTAMDMGLLMQGKGGEALAEFFGGSRVDASQSMGNGNKAALAVVQKFVSSTRVDAIKDLEDAGVKASYDKKTGQLVIDPNQSADKIALAQALNKAMAQWDSGAAGQKTLKEELRTMALGIRDTGKRIKFDPKALGKPTTTTYDAGFPARWFGGETKIVSYDERNYTPSDLPPKF